MDAFTAKYGAPGSPGDPQHIRSDTAFRALQDAFGNALTNLDISGPQEVQDVITGLLCGVADLAVATCAQDDATHAKLRDRLSAAMPAAIDCARYARGLPPLPEGSAP